MSDPLLTTTGLGHHFSGVVALDDVSLELRAGEVLGVIGPNGAGKTTLLNAICGVVRPARGSVTFLEHDVTGGLPNRLAKIGLGRTFQMAEGFGDFTVWDYLQLSRGCARDPDGAGAIGAAGYARRCEEWLDWVGAGVRADALMHNLSYGVRKLVDLCRVVATEPVVTLLDEPTSGLAAADRERMRDRIAALREAGRTLVIVDHDVSFVTDVSTRVAAFVQGRKIADGRPGDVLRDPNVSMSYLGS